MSDFVHNETTKLLETLGFERTDDFICPETQICYPCYKMSDYINTIEGCNLYAECLKKKDMKPYYDAKTEYYKNKSISRKEAV